MPENETSWLDGLPKSWLNCIHLLYPGGSHYISHGWLSHDGRQIYAHEVEMTAVNTARITRTLKMNISDITIIMTMDLKTGIKKLFMRQMTA